jgi:hydroxypyruvate isomerase
MAFKQAVSSWPLSCVPEQDQKRVLELGITGVEMPPRSDCDKYRDMGFSIVTYVGHQSLEDGLNRRENHARIADEIRTNLELAKKYEIPNLVCFSGNRGGKSDEEGAANTIEGLRMVARDAETAGVNLVIELLNSKADHPDYQCDHTSWGVQVVQAWAARA